MALIECPECAKPVSQTAESCPSCGYKLNNRSDSSSSTRRILLIVAICLGIFGAIVGFTVGSPAFGAVGAVAVVVSGIKLAL
jgi:hypothetical protein